MTAERRRRIVVATGDTIGRRMAGPAVRALNLAELLAREHDVRLVSTAGAEPIDSNLDVSAVGDGELATLAAWSDVLVVQGWVLAGRPEVSRRARVVVADLYDPMPLEQLEQGHEAPDERGRWRAVEDTAAVMNEQLVRGDFFVCASERQRAYYLGQLVALGRVNPATYDADPTLRSLLDVVPFGIPAEVPTRTAPGLRGVVPGIDDGDVVLLWGGGIYNWLDPVTVVEAVDRVRDTIPRVRLVFMGARHPNPEIPEMRAAASARALAESRGLLDVHVFFNEGWVPYDERHNVLLDADIGVSAHLDHVETEFSYRTRILDYVWAGLPVVTTAGDAIGALVAEKGLGAAVPPGDAEAFAAALVDLVTDEGRAARVRASVQEARASHCWETVAAPLLRFCRDPLVAPDHRGGDARSSRQPRIGVAPRSGWRHEAEIARRHLEEGGAKQLAVRAAHRLRRTIRKGDR